MEERKGLWRREEQVDGGEDRLMEERTGGWKTGQVYVRKQGGWKVRTGRGERGKVGEGVDIWMEEKTMVMEKEK
jgi:hypothetical protein